MICRAVMAVVVSLFLASVGRADDVTDNQDSRFAFYRTADGFLRLDGRSGEVSMCTRRSAGWVCSALADERLRSENRFIREQEAGTCCGRAAIPRI